MTFAFVSTMKIINKHGMQSLKRICKGEYTYVDPLNTKCLELIDEYHKVHEEFDLVDVMSSALLKIIIKFRNLLRLFYSV